MKYDLVERPNPQDRKAPKKFYATPVWEGIVGIDELSDIIAGRSSLTAGDVSNVLHNLLDEVPRLLLMGKAVDLDLVGIVRISFGSAGAETAEAFNTNMIRDVKIIYRASPKLKERVLTKVKFEKVIHKDEAQSSTPVE